LPNISRPRASRSRGRRSSWPSKRASPTASSRKTSSRSKPWCPAAAVNGQKREKTEEKRNLRQKEKDERKDKFQKKGDFQEKEKESGEKQKKNIKKKKRLI